MVFTAAQPFTSTLITSNIKNFKYTWVWEKSKASGHLNAKRMPLRAHEDICVFYRKPPLYNPQMTKGQPYHKGTWRAKNTPDVWGEQRDYENKNDSGLRYPRTVQYFRTAESEGKLHPTQKPQALFEYLIKTYTSENDVVLDSCIGSGTRAIAALSVGRKYIGIELERKYIDITNDRIKQWREENED